MSNTKVHDHDDSTDNIWDERYREEGSIWGDDPSSTSQALADELELDSNICEVGFGYGRDMRELVEQGNQVTGVELSSVGLAKANNDLSKHIASGRAHLILGDFARAALPKDNFDAVFSHRVLHLLGSNGLVSAFAKQAHNILKPDGILCISARDERDFNSNQMKWVSREDNIAEYKDRPGHIISFWNEDRFRSTFSKRFEIISLEKSEEMESMKNRDTVSYFTVMVARKKVPVEYPVPNAIPAH